MYPEEAVVDGPDTEDADFPRSDVDDAVAGAENARFPRWYSAAAAAETAMVRVVET